MFKRLRNVARLHPTLLLGAGAGLMVVAAMLISAHISTIITIRDFSVPIVSELPKLERRLSLLQEQVELSQLHAAVRIGSQQEKVEVYALPEETNVSKVVATFEVISDVLKRDGVLDSMQDLTIEGPMALEDGGAKHTVATEFVIHEDGMKTVMLLIELSGLLTIGDVLTEEEVGLLVQRIEEENPSGIVALEQFLSADLLKYVKDSKTYEEQLKRSFSSTAFLKTFKNILRTSLLKDTKNLLRSDLGQVLVDYKLWPMQMMAIEEVSIAPGSAPKWHRLGLTLSVFHAES